MRRLYLQTRFSGKNFSKELACFNTVCASSQMYFFHIWVFDQGLKVREEVLTCLELKGSGIDLEAKGICSRWWTQEFCSSHALALFSTEVVMRI
jgi:hypothetical protein